tara:strand:+ start:234 stop:452 length:219 start_codon:yes stop_codon:yes gene_type:complete
MAVLEGRITVRDVYEEILALYIIIIIIIIISSSSLLLYHHHLLSKERSWLVEELIGIPPVLLSAFQVWRGID